MKYLSDSVMLDTLKKVQALQAEILTTGRSAHIDAYIHENFPEIDMHHISFELTIFEGNKIIRSFDFTSADSEDILNATYDLAVAYVKYLENV